MPQGLFIVLPFIMSMAAFVLMFTIYSACDLVKTDWSIDCSTALTPNCVFLAEIEMGLLGTSIAYRFGNCFVPVMKGHTYNRRFFQLSHV